MRCFYACLSYRAVRRRRLSGAACRLIRPHIVFIRVFPQGCGSAGRCLNGRPPLAIRPHFHPGVRLPGLEFQRSHPP